jgi:uncharacterized protein (TIGR03382 family)
MKEVATAPFEVKVDAPGREVTLTWSKLESDRLELVVDATAGTHKDLHRSLSLTFPMGFDRIVYAPATDEDNVVDLAASDFTMGVEHTIPAPSGLVGLGPTQFLVKDVRSSHLALIVKPASREVEVRDETLHAPAEAHWRFEVVSGDATHANALAQQLNLNPVVEYDLEPRGGCGCGAGGGMTLFGLLALVRRRRH